MHMNFRACLSVAIVEMVIPINVTATGNQSIICPVDNELPIGSNSTTNSVSESLVMDIK